MKTSFGDLIMFTLWLFGRGIMDGFSVESTDIQYILEVAEAWTQGDNDGDYCVYITSNQI